MSEPHHHPLSDIADWDALYGGEHGESIWSGKPNAALVAEVTGMTVGKAIDLGCGEGGDAIWLAEQGWEVTAIDISNVALDRARERSFEAGVDVEWVCADFVEHPPAKGDYDLVTTHYPALLKSQATVPWKRFARESALVASCSS